MLPSAIHDTFSFVPHHHTPFYKNYEKHAPRVSQVIAAVAKVSCKHGLWLVARVSRPADPVLPGVCGLSFAAFACSFLYAVKGVLSIDPPFHQFFIHMGNQITEWLKNCFPDMYMVKVTYRESKVNFYVASLYDISI